MSNAFREVTHVSWFSKIGNSFGGALFGIVIAGVATWAMFWNEGRAVRTAVDLAEGRGAAQTISAERVDPAMNGKFVHLTATAQTQETLRDDLFGVEAVAIKLRREVEMYQWIEKKETETKKKLGGGEERVTTYHYRQDWTDDLINSREFKQSGHDNPTAFPFPADSWEAGEVRVGAFRLSRSLVSRIHGDDPLPPPTPTADRPALKDMRVNGDDLYRGADPAKPQIGDVRVRWRAVKPKVVTLVAGQTGDTFEPYRLHTGRTLEMLSVGEFSVDGMFTAAEQFNSFLTWVIRGAGLLGAWLGMALLLSPLGALADVVPLFGTIIRWGTGALSFLLASVIASTTIAIAWFWYRPWIAVAVLLGTIVLFFLMRALFRRSPAPSPALAGFAPPPPPPPPAT